MKGIRNIWFIFVVAVLVAAIACGQNADPAAPSEGAAPAAEPSGATQASADPVDEVETSADAPEPNMADFMDEATVRLFEQMTPEWQESTREIWVGITKLAPREDWGEAAQSAVSQS